MDKITISMWSPDNNCYVDVITGEIANLQDYNYIVYRLYDYISKAVIDRFIIKTFYNIYLNEKITTTLLNAVCENIIA